MKEANRDKKVLESNANNVVIAKVQPIITLPYLLVKI